MSRRPLRPLAIALVLAMLPALAACGGPSREDFRSDFRPLNARIMDLGRDVGIAVTGAAGKSDKQIQEQFEGLARRTGTIARDVDALEAPEEIDDERTRLVEAMGDGRDSLSEIAAAAGRRDPQAARRATIQLLASSEDLRAARTRLERAARGSG